MDGASDVVVVGSGSWGSALAYHLASHGVATCLTGREVAAIKRDGENSQYLPGVAAPSTLQLCEDVEHAVSQAQLVLVAVPSAVFASVLLGWQHMTHLKQLAWATKGLDHTHGRLLSDVVQQTLPQVTAMGVVSGPTFAMEVARGKPAAMNVASQDQALVQALCHYLSRGACVAYGSDDVVGVQLAGAIKNVIAIVAGVSDGLGYGANARCALITRGLQEMCRLGRAMGAKQATFLDMAGVGDLMLTATDDQSRNRRFGLALGRGVATTEAEQAIGQVVEGKVTAATVQLLAKQHGVAMPVVDSLCQLFDGHLPLDQLISVCMADHA